MSAQNRPARKIAVEEAFSIPAHMDELKRAADAYTGTEDGDLLLAKRQTGGGEMTKSLLDLDGRRLELMDEAGIDLALLLITAPGVQAFSSQDGVRIARQVNDTMAELVSRHPTRFAALAAVAPQAAAEAAKEIERAMTTLGMKGVVINSHTNGEYLSEEKYWPLLEAAEAHDAPIYIHPRSPIPDMAKAYLPDNLSHAIYGFQAETGLHGLRLITGGIFDRFPKLQIVLGHAGEGLPFWLDRIDYMYAKPRGRRVLKHRPSDYFMNNFSVTTSGMNWHAQIRYLIEKLGSDHVMFAADYPYQIMLEEVAQLDSAPIGDADRENIYCRTAERVFKL